IIGLLIIIGTGLLLLLVKFRVYNVWKVWFFIAVWATLSVAFGVYLNWMVAATLAFALGLWKILKPNVFVYNFTEVFIYTGIAILMLPLLNLFAAFGLLIIISLYDMYAVWQSKHMIKMAKFQTDSKVFAGLFIPYKIPSSAQTSISGRKSKAVKSGSVKTKIRSAILGGGDIAFPLLFSGAVMEHLITVQGIAKPAALGLTGIIALCSGIALFILLAKAEEKKFYPAMPFLSLGCFIGSLIIFLITLY
ncbi:MAG: hypothetical protein KKE20_04500, partial [Nanoarchaeota archaeon]|nr:hypothetical protein [Nanoarchaeota archaeon]